MTRTHKIAAALVVTLIGLAVAALKSEILSTRQGHAPTDRPSTASVPTVQAPEPIDVDEVMREIVEPSIRVLNEENDAAVGRFTAAVHVHFDHARAGAPRFAQDVLDNPFSTAYLRLKDAALNWWRENQDSHEARALLEASFATHVLNEQSLFVELNSAATRLNNEVVSNQMQAVEQIRRSVGASPFGSRINLDASSMSRAASGDLNDVFEASVGGGSGSNEALFHVVEIATNDAIRRVANATAIIAASANMVAQVPAIPPHYRAIAAAVSRIFDAVFYIVSLFSDGSDESEHRSSIVSEVVGHLNAMEREIVTGSIDQPGLADKLRQGTRIQADEIRTNIRAQVERSVSP